MQTNPMTEKLWNPSYILMLILNILTFTGFMMVNPLLVPYAISIGASMKFASLIAGIFAITALVARPFAGLAVDRINKKHLMHIATALLMLATLGYSLAPDDKVLMAVRIFHGLFFAVGSTGVTSLATVYIPRGKLGQGIGYMGMTYIVGSGLGPNLGIIIRDGFGDQAAFISAASLLALAAVLMFFLKNPAMLSQRPGSSERKKIRPSDLIAPELLFLSGLTVCFSLLNGLIGNYILLLAEEKQIANIGYFFTVSTAVLLVVRPLTGYLIDHKRLAAILIPAFLLATLAAVLLGLASSLLMVLGAAVIYAIGQGSGTPAIQTTCIRKLGPARVGVATSTYFIGMDVGQSIGAVAGGLAADALGGFTYVFLGAAAILVLGMISFMIFGRDSQKRNKPA